MKSISATKARQNLYSLIDETGASHVPVQITGKRNNAILISEEDWMAMEETIYLLSIPNMRESIRNGLNTPLTECNTDPGW